MLKQASETHKLRYAFAVFFVSLAALSLSTLASGAGHGHYALQLLPFVSVAYAAALVWVPLRGKGSVAISALTVGLILVSSAPALEKSRELWARHQAGRPLTHGLSYWAADLIRDQGLDDYSVYAMERNLVYWLLDEPVLVPLVTHPSNITNPPLIHALYGPNATPGVVLEEVLAQSPTFIVRREAFNYLADFPEADAMLERALRRYTEIGRNGDLVVYKANRAGEAP
jgi:hypothetical protein